MAKNEVKMLAVVRFPTDKDEEGFTEAVATEIDNVFDFMDERVNDGAEASDLLAAMLIVIQLISRNAGNVDNVH